MEEKDRTLGLRSVVSISVGLVIATSCLVSVGHFLRTVHTCYPFLFSAHAFALV